MLWWAGNAADEPHEQHAPGPTLVPRTQSEHEQLVDRERSSFVDDESDCSKAEPSSLLTLSARAAAYSCGTVDSFACLPSDLAQLVFDQLASSGSLKRDEIPKFMHCHLVNVRAFRCSHCIVRSFFLRAVSSQPLRDHASFP